MSIPTAPTPPTEITYDTFKEWTNTCGVRRIQKEYEKLAETAHKNDRSIQEEMRVHGFKDFNTFSKACPRFSVTCWPTEFAELGSGFVMYFHFISFLAFVLLVVFLIQIPSMALYAKENRLNYWEWNDWHTAFSTQSSPFSVPPGASNTLTFVAANWLTPGNFGPDQATGALIPTLLTVCVVVVCGLIFVAYQQQMVTERFVDATTTSPNDFAVVVRGLPATATDDKALMKFFSENAVKGRTDVPIVKVVIGWDAQEFREKLRLLKSLRETLLQLSQDDAQAADIKRQMASISSDLDTAAPGCAARLRSSGVVIVVFRYQGDMRACLDRWTGFWARWFYREAEDCCWLPRGNGMWKGQPMPRFPIGDPPIPVHKLSIDRAPNPGDIMWEELGIDWQTRAKMLVKTNAIMIVLIAASFGITYGFNRLQEFIKEQAAKGASGTQFLSFLPAFCVAIMNGLLVMASRKLAVMEYHETATDEEFSQAIKMSVGMVLNTAGIVYLINAQPKEWYQSGGLVNDIFTMLLINSIIPPIMPYFDLGFKIRGRIRGKLTPQMLEHFTEVVKRGAPKTPEQAEELKQVKAQIEFFKRAYAPSTMNNPRRYATALKTFVCCLWYMPVLPWVAAIGCFGLLLQYWVDKYMLLRWYKRPEKPANSNMAMFSLQFIKFIAPVGLSVSFYVFLTPSWYNKNEVLSNFVISIVVACLFPLLPISLWARALLMMPCLSHSQMGNQEEDYYKAQYMWSKEMKYHKDQFIYKVLPESKNPEFLQPGTDSTVKVDDVKATYGVATAKVAEDARLGLAGSATVLKTGRVIAAGSDIAGPALGPSPTSPGPAPAIYGARLDAGIGSPAVVSAGPCSPTSPGWQPTAAVASASSAGGSPPATSAGYLPGHSPAVSPYVPHDGPSGTPSAIATVSGVVHVGAPTGSGSAAAVWEYEVNHGFTPFADDCQEFIERKYKEYKERGGRDQINVRTTGITVSINFRLMTTKKDGSHKIRGIRRKDAS